MRTLLVASLAALAALAPLPGALAQPDPEQVANETVEKGKTAVDGILGDAGDTVSGLEAQAPDTGLGAKGPGGGLGAFLQAVADVAATAAVATGKALAAVGTALAAGLAAAASKSLAFATAALTALGAAMAAVLAAGSSALASGLGWLGAQLGALLGLYAGLVAKLRPDGMDPAAFTAIASAGVAGTSAAAGYGLWSLLRRYAWILSAGAGFSRIADSELLEHPLRAHVFQVIQQNPGIHASELSRKVGAGWGTIVHHLDKLEKGRLVTARRVNNQKCFFEDGGKVSRQDMAVAGAVRGDSASLITAYVTAHPMTSQKAMAAEIGVSPALVSFHVKKLAALGVLEKVRRGKETLLTTTQAVRRVLPLASPQPAAPAAAAQA